MNGHEEYLLSVSDYKFSCQFQIQELRLPARGSYLKMHEWMAAHVFLAVFYSSRRPNIIGPTAENDSAAIPPPIFFMDHICSLLNMNLSTYLNIITYCIRHSRWDPPWWLIVGESKSISMHTQLGSMISEVWNLIPHNFTNYGGFHLHLLVFPFVHQFNSRIGVLVHSSFGND